MDVQNLPSRPPRSKVAAAAFLVILVDMSFAAAILVMLLVLFALTAA
jgi:hypothetical protein